MNTLKLWMIQHSEQLQAILLALLAAAMFFLAGCSSCPPPEVVVKPELVEVAVPMEGSPLPVCEEPGYEVCNQLEAADRVRCIGRNHQRLVVCHETNVDTMRSHNAALAN